MPLPERRKRLWKAGAVILCAGLFYGYVLLPLGICIPCPFYRITGLRCPGCGITNFCRAILHGRFAEAPAYNWGLTLSAPAILWLLMSHWREWDRRRENAVGVGLLIFLLGWGVFRNIAGL